jgi:RNA polymerase subunit RPABC4/transcription elongation factor Spt4|tara:strand:- start:307 stop:510 length:204 start_codon:yes stop_codon:yes gene_type:complete
MKKVCKKCKAFVEGKVCTINDPDCPAVKHNQYATSFQGRVIILDANKSEIAKKVEINIKGEYAIKIR